MSEEKLSILIVDDEQWFANPPALVHRRGLRCRSSMSAPDALAKAGRREFDLVIADIRMPAWTASNCCEKIRAEQLDTA